MSSTGKRCRTGENIPNVMLLFSVTLSYLFTDITSEQPCSPDVMKNGSIFPVMPLNCFLEKYDSHKHYKGPGAETGKVIPPHFRATFIGCYEQINSNHKDNATWRSNEMTLLDCLVSCSLLGSTYVGLQSGDRCYCHQNPLSLMKPPQKEHRHCLLPCRGNKLFACGGHITLALYRLIVTDLTHNGKPFKKHGVKNSRSPRFAQPSSASISLGSGIRKVKRHRQIPLWTTDAPGVYLGCYEADDNNENKRTPKLKTFPKMSIEDCTNFCRSLGIRYAALYGEDCHCGAGPLSKYTAFNAMCNLDCPSNRVKQFCGGQRLDNDRETGAPNGKVATKTKHLYLQAYRLDNPRGFDSFRAIFIGCYRNNPLKNATVLTSKFEFVSKNMSVDICVEMCQIRGYPFALISIPGGTLSGDFKCNCALTYFAQSRPSNISNCKIKCPSDNRQFCGGATPVAYQLHAALPPRGMFSNYGIFLGCFLSLPPGETNRIQLRSADTDRTEAKQGNTDRYYLDRCVHQCWGRGFHIVAVTSGAICACVKTDDWKAERVGNRLDDGKCNMPCGDASGDYCGGENVYQIYRVRNLERVVQ